MNGNITEDGARQDLDLMSRIGFGGVQVFEGNLGTPTATEHRLVYMSPDWQAAFRFSAKHAQQLGLELTIATSPSWSASGGPWVAQGRDEKGRVERDVCTRWHALPRRTATTAGFL